jgi:hypothetical protein
MKNINIKLENEEYPLYYSLNPSKVKSLDATNYWRVLNGLKEIPVPPSNTDYHKYFDKRCYDLAQSYQIRQAETKKFMNQLNYKHPIEPIIEPIIETIQEAFKEPIQEKPKEPIIQPIQVQVKEPIQLKAQEPIKIKPKEPIEIKAQKPKKVADKKTNNEQPSLF